MLRGDGVGQAIQVNHHYALLTLQLIANALWYKPGKRKDTSKAPSFPYSFNLRV